MKEKRYYTNQSLQENSVITIDGEEFHHMTNVMRSRVGDKICLFNGDGNFYFAEIINILKRQAEVKILSKEISKNEPKANVTLFQALAKGDKLSLIMQKITELGATNMCLFESKFTDVKSNTHKQDRLDSISISAAKQCGRATITNTKGIFKIQEVYNQIADYDAFYVAYENEDGHTLTDAILNNIMNKPASKPLNIAIMIGAEGGFSEDEITALKQNGAEIVSLGNRILRTETAAISCIALITQILKI